MGLFDFKNLLDTALSALSSFVSVSVSICLQSLGVREFVDVTIFVLFAVLLVRTEILFPVFIKLLFISR